MKIAGEYICAMCKETFKKAWSDAEAEREAKENFGVERASQDSRMVVICDDCFKIVDPKKFPELVKNARRELGTL